MSDLMAKQRPEIGYRKALQIVIEALRSGKVIPNWKAEACANALQNHRDAQRRADRDFSRKQRLIAKEKTDANK